MFIMKHSSLVVKPDASPEEVRAVVNDENGGQIFSQAVRIFGLYFDGRCSQYHLAA